MRVVFTDKQGEDGEALDDGTRYSWSYAGSGPDIISILEEARTLTGVDTGPVSSKSVDDMPGERFCARIEPEWRGRWLAGSLQEYLWSVKQLE